MPVPLLLLAVTVKKTPTFSTAIIGGGMSGLATACYLAHRGEQVALYESHNKLGGCAGYFGRKYPFHAGATTLSGYGKNTPLTRFLKTLSYELKIHSDQYPLEIRGTSFKLRRYRNREQWVDELIRVFARSGSEGEILRKTWRKVFWLEDHLWEGMRDFSFLPPQSLKDIFNFLKKVKPQYLRALPGVFRSVSQVMELKKLSSSYQQFIGEQLLISAQNTPDDTPFIVGALGLAYPETMVNFAGGMPALIKKMESFIEEHGGVIYRKTLIEKIEKREDFFSLFHREQCFQAKTVVSTLPLWNIAKITRGNLQKYLQKKAHAHPRRWGALSAYALVTTKEKLNSFYLQIHLTSQEKMYQEQGSLFFSFFPQEENQYTLTVSTHFDLNKMPQFYQRYDAEKKRFAELVKSLLQRHFLEMSCERIIVGTPRSFERYTQREEGCVGGIPYSLKEKTLFRFQGAKTPDKNFYLLGDTTFPGQGVIGVLSGVENFLKIF